MKRLIVTVWLASVCMVAAAQVDLDSAKAELYRINRVFDSSLYIGFNVHLVYSTDTIYGRYAYEQLDGSYILNNRNIYYRMGNNEYMQNDSFVYNIYHDERTMMMTKDPVSDKSNLFPLRSFVDSVLTWYDTAYTISMSALDDSRVLSFTARYDSLPYKRFAIYYQEETYYPDSIEMKFFSGGDESDTVFLIGDTIEARPIIPDQITRHVIMSFSDYYIPSSLVVFQDSNYVYLNRQTRRYRPAEKFRGYRFLANGVEPEGYDETIEVYPPPAGE
ncbi:MAG: hypothetical protein ABW019_02780 [Chitinophagaceae bacterium]